MQCTHAPGRVLDLLSLYLCRLPRMQETRRCATTGVLPVTFDGKGTTKTLATTSPLTEQKHQQTPLLVLQYPPGRITYHHPTALLKMIFLCPSDMYVSFLEGNPLPVNVVCPQQIELWTTWEIVESPVALVWYGVSVKKYGRVWLVDWLLKRKQGQWKQWLLQ